MEEVFTQLQNELQIVIASKPLLNSLLTKLTTKYNYNLNSSFPNNPSSLNVLLYYCSVNRYIEKEVLSLLINKFNCDCRIVDIHGNNMLHLMVKKNVDVEIIEYVLREINVFLINIPNNLNETPLFDIVKIYGCKEIFYLFEKYANEINHNKVNVFGQNLIHVCHKFNKDIEAIRFINSDKIRDRIFKNSDIDYQSVDKNNHYSIDYLINNLTEANYANDGEAKNDNISNMKRNFDNIESTISPENVNLSNFFSAYNYLDYGMKISNDLFADFGLNKQLNQRNTPHFKVAWNQTHVVYTYDTRPESNDYLLRDFIQNMLETHFQMVKVNKERRSSRLNTIVISLIKSVNEFFGGNSSIYQYNSSITYFVDQFSNSLRDLQNSKQSNFINVGEINNIGCGFNRLRTVLLKLVCDYLDIPCRLVRLVRNDTSENIYAYYCIIKINSMVYMVSPTDHKFCLSSEITGMGFKDLKYPPDIHKNVYFLKSSIKVNLLEQLKKDILRTQAEENSSQKIISEFGITFDNQNLCVKVIDHERLLERYSKSINGVHLKYEQAVEIELNHIRFINHPNIDVPVAFYMDGNMHYYVYESQANNLLDNWIKELLNKGDKESILVNAYCFCYKFLKIIQFLHDNHIMHYNLVHENIFVEYDENYFPTDVKVRLFNGVSRMLSGANEFGIRVKKNESILSIIWNKRDDILSVGKILKNFNSLIFKKYSDQYNFPRKNEMEELFNSCYSIDTNKQFQSINVLLGYFTNNLEMILEKMKQIQKKGIFSLYENDYQNEMNRNDAESEVFRLQDDVKMMEKKIEEDNEIIEKYKSKLELEKDNRGLIKNQEKTIIKLNTDIHNRDRANTEKMNRIKAQDRTIVDLRSDMHSRDKEIKRLRVIIEDFKAQKRKQEFDNHYDNDQILKKRRLN